MTNIRIETTDRELVQVKFFEAPLDGLRVLEDQINAWLRENREVRIERVQFNTIETKRAVVMLWYAMTTRSSRGVGFGTEAVPQARS